MKSTPLWTEKNLVLLLLGALGILFYILAVSSVSSEGGADAFQHYFISRYSYQYPEKFFDLWGKPVFTFLSAPFSQFGILGTKIYNICVALLSAWLTWRIAVKLRLKMAPLAVLFLCFAPIYFGIAISSMTEITFGLVLILSIHLMIQERYAWGAFVISFLPFARQEGVFIILIFLVFLAWKRKFKVLPLLLSGFVILSLAGYPFRGSLDWIIKEESFTGSGGIYGHGEWNHFLVHYREIAGFVIAPLIVLGCFYTFINIVRRGKSFSPKPVEVIFLLYGVFLAFVAGHSYVWWKGIAGSLGLTRVMAGIIPVAAIIALHGYQLLLPFLTKSRLLHVAFAAGMFYVLFTEPFRTHEIPVRLSEPEALLKQMSDWVNASEYKDRLVYYYDPTACFLLDKNPFDKTSARERVPNSEHPEIDSEEGALVIWDAHFAPHQMPLERLTENGFFRVVKKFTPEHPFTMLGNNYEIYVLLREAPKNKEIPSAY